MCFKSGESTCPTSSTFPTCPRTLPALREDVPKYILKTKKLKILVLMKSNEGLYTDVFMDAEF